MQYLLGKEYCQFVAVTSTSEEKQCPQLDTEEDLSSGRLIPSIKYDCLESERENIVRKQRRYSSKYYLFPTFRELLYEIWGTRDKKLLQQGRYAYPEEEKKNQP